MFQKYEGRKTAALVAAVFSVFAVLFLLLLYALNQRVKVIDVSGCEKDTGNMVYNIEEVGTFYNYISVQGYAYLPGEDIDVSCIRVLMYDDETDTCYALPTETDKREEITERAGDGHDYDYCGFRSAAYQRKLGGNGRLMILYECNGKRILIDPDREEG